MASVSIEHTKYDHLQDGIENNYYGTAIVDVSKELFKELLEFLIDAEDDETVKAVSSVKADLEKGYSSFFEIDIDPEGGFDPEGGYIEVESSKKIYFNVDATELFDCEIDSAIAESREYFDASLREELALGRDASFFF